MNWRAGTFSALLLALLFGCAEVQFARTSFERPFRFEEDSFAFANELVWSYAYDMEGTWRATGRARDASYTHRCFVLARSARQFFQHARFDPSRPAPGEEELRRLVHRIVRISPRLRLPDEERVVIPGFASLRELSLAHETLLKDELGGAFWSYNQRGNWRMVMPFGRGHQEETAASLVSALEQRRPPIVHLVRFPRIAINHALLLYRYDETGEAIHFGAYDPNAPEQPVTLTYDRAARTFSLPHNAYFRGGRVDVYEIYHRPWF
jgi:hypothetical protein